jgi:hypothetical protein
MISYLQGSGVCIVIQFQAQYDIFTKFNIIFICIYPLGAVPQFTGGFHCAKICSGPASVTVACKGAVGFVWPAHIFTLSIYHFHSGYQVQGVTKVSLPYRGAGIPVKRRKSSNEKPPAG